MTSDASAKPKMGLSLYANLLDPGSKEASAATISSAPVVYDHQNTGGQADDAAAQKQQISNAALRFQPTRRPQAAAPKKAVPAKFAPTASQPVTSANADTNTAPKPHKSTIEDWAGDGEEDEYYGATQRQRGGRKRRKKNKEQGPAAQDWDDIYDPSRPNNYEEYKNSDEKIRELREWKDRLYAHRIARGRSMSSDSDSGSPRRPAMQFAPPPAHAPPPPPPAPEPYHPPPPPAAEIPHDESGEDAFARRMRMAQDVSGANMSTAAPSPPKANAPQTDPRSVAGQTSSNAPASTISRAPVRYSLPSAPEEIPASEAELESALAEEAQGETPAGGEEPRSLRPGQKGFAARLMAKYGYTKGSGLGADSKGIVTPLQAKLEKQKKKPDSEGGGFAGPSGMGKIVGGKKKGGDDEGKFGRMSEVVILRGMVDGMDLQHELGEGNLMQEIGEECGEKYGRVERVYIEQSAPANPPVFVKFTSQLSALRAVNALEGRTFNGNTITARFFDAEKFDNGVYQ